MKHIITKSIALMMVFGFLTGCAERGYNTVGGAALGGVAGNALTGGSPIGTIGGAVAGGVVGNQFGH